MLAGAGPIRWGGDIRRARILERLAARTQATVGPLQPSRAAYDAAVRADGLRLPWTRRPRPRLASAHLLTSSLLGSIRRRTRPAVLDLHDDPIAQRTAFGLAADDQLVAQWQANLDAFPRLVVPSASFIDLAGLDPARTIVIPNGTDTAHVRPGPWPTRPTIGMVSGAAPGRGIETLIDAARLVRLEVPDTTLLLWLVAASEATRAYLDALASGINREDWIELATVPYDGLSAALARATVLAIPHPPNPYMDVALPVKLFDSMAAGRPVVATPRVETAALLAATGAGVVAAGDAPDDLAAAITGLLGDPVRAAELGRAGRRAAEREFDWTVLGDRLADAVLADPGAS